MDKQRYLNGEVNFAAIEKIDQIHSDMNEFKTWLPHLGKLDALEDIKDHLMDAATGKNQIEVKTATLIFKILGGVIIAQTVTIVFMLTGQHFGLFGLFGK